MASLVIAQPLLELLGSHPQFFVASSYGPKGLVFLAFLVTLPVPLVLLGVEILLARFSRRYAWAAHLVFLAGLLALAPLQAMKRSGAPDGLTALALAIAAGAVLASVYARSRTLRSLFSVLALAAIVVPGLFLLRPQVRAAAAGTYDVAVAEIDLAERPPIVFLVFDELPLATLLDGDGNINGARYPNFARLAATSTWYRNAAAVAESTMNAVPALVTGLLPDSDLLPTARDYPRGLFTWLAGSYSVWAHEPVTALCPPRFNRLPSADASGFADRWRRRSADLGVVYAHLSVPSPWDAALPPISSDWESFRHGDELDDVDDSGERARKGRQRMLADARLRNRFRAARRLRLARMRHELHRDARAELYFAHILLPHGPWNLLPDGRSYRPPRGVPGIRRGRWGDDPFLVAQGHQRHLLQAGLVDLELGLLLDRLAQQDLLSRSLVVVVADHGSSYRPGDDRRRLTPTNFADISAVPLFVKVPGQRHGKVDGRPAKTLDVLPTIAAALGTELPWEVNGRSLLDAAETPAALRFVTNRKGTFELDREAIRRGVEETVAGKLRGFGDGTAGDDLYRLGPAPELVGGTVADFEAGPASPFRARVRRLGRLRSPKRDPSFVPVFFDAKLEAAGGEPPPDAVAVAVNGRVAAVAPPHAADEGPYRLTAMLVPRLLRDAGNEIALYAVARRADGVRLRSIAISQSEKGP